MTVPRALPSLWGSRVILPLEHEWSGPPRPRGRAVGARSGLSYPGHHQTVGTLSRISARTRLRSICLRGRRVKGVHWSWRAPCQVDFSPEQRSSCLCLFDSAAANSRGLRGWTLGWSHYSNDEWSGQANFLGEDCRARPGRCLSGHQAKSKQHKE